MKSSITKRIAAFVFAVLLTVSTVSAQVSFYDVSPSDWFYPSLTIATQSGLINGKNGGLFAPNDNMTYAEAIKIAAGLNRLHNGDKPTLNAIAGQAWYQPYINHARRVGIPCDFEDYNAFITRREYVNMFYKALPKSEFTEINTVPDNRIPDVKMKDKFAEAIYAFYKAGIITGSDANLTFNPDNTIRRSEVAAIIARIIDKRQRREFNINVGFANEGTLASYSEKTVGLKEGEVEYEKKSHLYTFKALPRNTADIEQHDMLAAHQTAALAVCAIAQYDASNPAKTLDMLQIVLGDSHVLSEADIAAVNNRMASISWNNIGYSYMAGARPENLYTPTTPYVIEIEEEPKPSNVEKPSNAPVITEETYMIRSAGAANPVYVTLNMDRTTKKWYITLDSFLALLQPIM